MSMEDQYFWFERMLSARLSGNPHQAMYRCSFEEWRMVQRCHRLTLRKHLRKGDRIVDVGCGNGCLTECLPADVVYHGIDLNPYLIAWARQEYERYKSLTFEVADGKDLSHISDKAYDVCISRSVLGCLGKDSGVAAADKLASEIERISKRSILLGFTIPTEAIVRRHP